MVGKRGFRREDLVKSILRRLKKCPDGIWIRKLARELEEPVMTIHKYVNRKDYVGRYVEKKKQPKELGGHVIIKLKKVRK